MREALEERKVAPDLGVFPSVACRKLAREPPVALDVPQAHIDQRRAGIVGEPLRLLLDQVLRVILAVLLDVFLIAVHGAFGVLVIDDPLLHLADLALDPAATVIVGAWVL